MVIAVDSRVHRAGGRVERSRGKKRRCVKVHFAVNVETGEAAAAEVTADYVHDSTVFLRLLEEDESRGRL